MTDKIIIPCEKIPFTQLFCLQFAVFNRGTVLGAFKPFNDALLDISEAGENVVNPLVLYSSAALILLGTILTIGSYLALRGRRYSTYFCLQTWFILPLFFLLIISVCVIAAVSSSLLTVNSGK